jgi:hypothetical protein
MRLIRHNFANKPSNDKILEDKELEAKMYDAMRSNKPYAEIRKELNNLQDNFRKAVEKRTGLELISAKEIDEIEREIRKVPIGKEADLFLDMLVSEMYSCRMFGQKRSNEACIASCHYQELLCGKKTNCDSVRTAFSEVKYSKSLAWLLGDKQVETKHVATVLPYLLWHKMRFVENFMNEFKEDQRDDPFQLHVTKKAVNDLLQRFSKMKDTQEKMYELMAADKLKEAKELAEKADHPVFKDYLMID